MSNTMSTVEVVVANVANRTGYGAAATAGFLTWIGSNHFAVIFSSLIALLAFLIGTYLKLEERARKKEIYRLDLIEREARIKHLNRSSLMPLLTPVEDETSY